MMVRTMTLNRTFTWTILPPSYPYTSTGQHADGSQAFQRIAGHILCAVILHKNANRKVNRTASDYW